MNELVEAHMRARRYGDVSEYSCDLDRPDQERREVALQQLRDILDCAEASGLSGRTLPEITNAARVEARKEGLLCDKCCNNE